MAKELALKIEHVSKQYRLGQIGGGTLQGDIQSWWAQVRGKEDPNSKIGSKQHIRNERFWALDDVNIEVRKGEAVGIIGHNGAGKSTLLKLLSRVTAPTKGQISINGRIASMLEVGTGFHAEMTGRENIYMNGAILGMTKEEIDGKIEQIIDFSECRQFIDTPVKRYSSGMYVKLAFAVAAHLDSEILVMDEVLAVGDMKFQKKALGRMGEAAGEEGRTVLYVSHNMSTIRQLCTRCIVLDHGHVIFDGDVEEAIAIYSKNENVKFQTEQDLTNCKRYMTTLGARSANANKIKLLDIEGNDCSVEDNLKFELEWMAERHHKDMSFRFIILDSFKRGIASSEICNIPNACKVNKSNFDVNLKHLSNGVYYMNLTLFRRNEYGTATEYDVVFSEFKFQVKKNDQTPWCSHVWGHFKLPGCHINDTLVEAKK